MDTGSLDLFRLGTSGSSSSSGGPAPGSRCSFGRSAGKAGSNHDEGGRRRLPPSGSPLLCHRSEVPWTLA